MKYTGRVIGVFFTLFVIISIEMAYILWGDLFGIVFMIGTAAIGTSCILGKKYDKVKYYSERDSLTGLYNRRFLAAEFPGVMTRMDRKNEKLGVLLLDCDNFKVINDTYGHTQGDQVLLEVASLLKAKSRKGDYAVRWGGDEFLLIAPYADEAKVKAVIERFNKELANISEKLQINISVSCGSAVYPTEARTLDELIQAADTKLFLAKSANR